MGWEGSQHEAGTGEAASDMAGSGGHIYRRVPLLSQRGGDGCGQTAFKLGAGAAASSRAGAGTDPVAKGRREGRARRAFFFLPKLIFLGQTACASQKDQQFQCNSEMCCLPRQQGLASAGSESSLCALAEALLSKEDAPLQEPAIDQQFTIDACSGDLHGHMLKDNSALSPDARLSR